MQWLNVKPLRKMKIIQNNLHLIFASKGRKQRRRTLQGQQATEHAADYSIVFHHASIA